VNAQARAALPPWALIVSGHLQVFQALVCN